MWLTYAAAHNGFDVNNDVPLDTELRLAYLSARQTVDSSAREHTFVGCFAASGGGTHCLQPWTVYGVHVAALAVGYDGAPVMVRVSTQPTSQPAPVNIAVIDTTAGTATLHWDMPFLTGPVDVFVFDITSHGGGAQQIKYV